MKRRLYFLIFLLITTIFVNGCWDRRELESLGLVQAIGLDLEPNKKNLVVTSVIDIPSKLGASGQGGGGDESGVMVIDVKSPSIYEAFNLMNTTVNREITLQQNQLLVISEDMAKYGVNKWIDNLVRFREMRRTLLIFVCQGKASDIFKIKPPLEKTSVEYISDLAALSKITGMFPLVNLNNFMEHYQSHTQQNYVPLLAKSPLIKEEKESPESKDTTAEGGKQKKEEPKPDELRFIGTAVFRKDKMVGNLDIYETQILQMLTGKFGEALLTISDPLAKDNNIVIRLLGAAPPAIKYHKMTDIDQFNIKLHMEADIISIQSKIDYTNPKKGVLLANEIAKTIKHRIEKVITKTQEQFKSDIFGFGNKVKSTMLTTTEWDEYHWTEKYPYSKFNTNVKVSLRRIGVQFQPPQNME